MERSTKKRFALILECERATGNGVPPVEIRLRQALKILLRAFSFRAIDVREVSESTETAIAATESDV